MSNSTIPWTAPERPEWLQRFNAEADAMDIAAVVPLDPSELIATAKKMTGKDNFGDDTWREPFEVLIKSLNEEAELNFFGRLMARQDLLIWLNGLLGVQAAFDEHPEIEQEQVDNPVVIAGLSRSGTSILFELLAQDPRFGVPKQWEMMFPYPPPEKETYLTDPRIEQCQRVVTQWNRVTPTFQTMHEVGANIPNECIIGQACCFISEYAPGLYQVPSYMEWLGRNPDWDYSYGFYKRMLKVLQWRNPRQRWLLKAPSHLNYLPQLFDNFPEASVIITHRDPIVAQASVTNIQGTVYWQRSDKPLDVSAFEGLFDAGAMSARLDRIVDWIEDGDVPRDQVINSRYADLISDPASAIEKVYRKAGIPFDKEVTKRTDAYLQAKPKGKFGKHQYDVPEGERLAEVRSLYNRYQSYFDVPNEV